ncbi:MAG: helix-turn-helix transcriptional regulator [Clostridiales bacterium]|nr:helix-turn-helix transcriptional regulator [Clostridiales bacterium]
MDQIQEQINAFCQRLQMLRTEKGISQEQLSLDLGKEADYIASIESGAQVPSLETIFAICHHLDAAPSLLFDDEALLAARILALPEEQRAAVLEQLQKN